MQLKSAWKVWLLGLVALQHLEIAAGSRILAPFLFPSKSHSIMHNAVIRELVKRGHAVTYVTPFSMANENLGSNYTEILIPQFPVWQHGLPMTNAKIVLDVTAETTLTFIKSSRGMGLKSLDFAFEQPEFLKLFHAKNKTDKYDLLLTAQWFGADGALFLGHLYRIPTVTIYTQSFPNYMSSLVGTISPWSYVPHGYKPYTDRMSLMERIDNVYISLSEEILRAFWYYPAQDAILRKHFGDKFDSLPTIKELERNISAVLLNSYMPLETPKPISFNMIPVGGIHIPKPKPLPKKLQIFLDEAEHGAIYFSLGTQVHCADLPSEKLKIFLDVFRSLKQRILWRFENETMPNLPSNVMIQKWMPQSDILAHPNVKVFFSHGGLFGTQEAVHFGVPLLGMPIFGDQNLNVKRCKAAGFALSVDYRTVTEEKLRSTLTELLENSKYRDNIRRASKIFRDRPLDVMDTAMFWIKYVIEHRGAPHMVSAGLDLTWYQFYLLDIIAIALALILLPIFGLCLICRKGKYVSSPKKKSKRS